MSEKTDKKPAEKEKPKDKKPPASDKKPPPSDKKPPADDKKPPAADKKPPASESSKGKSSGPTGFAKMFNGNTTSGRANVAKATYAGIFLTYLFFKARKGKPPPPPPEAPQPPPSYHNDHDNHGHNDHDHNNHGHNGHTHHTSAGADINKWPNRPNNTSKEVFIIPNYKTDINFPNEMGDVPKSLSDSQGDDSNNNNNEQIRESVALNKLKRRISQNPRFMDP